MLEFHRTTEDEKKIISEWKYAGEYSVYNNPPYEEQLKNHRGFGNPRNNFFSFYDNGILIGYINLVEEENGVFFGIGVAPDLCGRGYGVRMSEMSWTLSGQLYPGKPLYLKVRTWNDRAVKCYIKAGFHIVGEPLVQQTPSGEGYFYLMLRE